ncbi:MAG: hypothetical protein V8Q42_10595 [Anaerovoracaceae bacterium]
MGAIGNGGTAVMPRLVEPTSFWDELLGKVPKVGVKTKDMIDAETASSLTDMMANNVEQHYGWATSRDWTSAPSRVLPRWVPARSLMRGSRGP